MFPMHVMFTKFMKDLSATSLASIGFKPRTIKDSSELIGSWLEASMEGLLQNSKMV